MATHPAFLVVRAKIAEALKAVRHMVANDSQQRSLAKTNPDLYSQTVHAESMATNVQGIFTHFEAILKSLTNTVDGFTPSGESSHRDLLLQVSVKGDNRGEIIDQDVLAGMSQLLRFRHAVRHNYAEDLRAAEVFENVRLLIDLSPKFVSNVESFISTFEDVCPNCRAAPCTCEGVPKANRPQS